MAKGGPVEIVRRPQCVDRGTDIQHQETLVSVLLTVTTDRYTLLVPCTVDI